jgi:hypothetical protein
LACTANGAAARPVANITARASLVVFMGELPELN